MRKLNYFLSLTAIVAVMSSCQQDDLEYGSSGGDNFTITAQASNQNSKISIDKLDVKWAVGDQLSVYVASKANVVTQFNLKAGGEGTNSAEFTPVVDFTLATAEYIYAVNPHSSDVQFSNESDVTYPVILNTTQIQDHVNDAIDKTSIGDYTLMYGKSTEAVVENPKLMMNHLMPILDFEINDIPTGVTISSVVLTSTTPMVTGGTINLDATESVFTPNAETSTTWTVTLNNAKVGGDNGSLTARLAILPQTITSGTKWTLKISGDDGVVRTLNRTFDVATKYSSGVVYSSIFPFLDGRTSITVALDDQNLSVGTLRGESDKFLARYAFNANKSSIDISYFDGRTWKHAVRQDTKITQEQISWNNGIVTEKGTFSAINLATGVLTSNLADVTLKSQKEAVTNMTSTTTYERLWIVPAVTTSTIGHRKGKLQGDAQDAINAEYPSDITIEDIRLRENGEICFFGFSTMRDIYYNVTVDSDVDSGVDIVSYKKSDFGGENTTLMPSDYLGFESASAYHQAKMPLTHEAMFNTTGLIVVQENEDFYLLGTKTSAWLKFANATSLSINDTELNVLANGETKSIAFTANANANVTALVTEGSSWCTASVVGTAIQVIAAGHTTSSSKVAKIAVSVDGGAAIPITVSQGSFVAGFPEALLVGTLRGETDNFLARYALNATKDQIQISYFNPDGGSGAALTHVSRTVSTNGSMLSWEGVNIGSAPNTITFSSIDGTTPNVGTSITSQQDVVTTFNTDIAAAEYLWIVPANNPGQATTNGDRTGATPVGDAKAEFKVEFADDLTLLDIRLDYVSNRSQIVLWGASGRGDVFLNSTVSVNSDIIIYKEEDITATTNALDNSAPEYNGGAGSGGSGTDGAGGHNYNGDIKAYHKGKMPSSHVAWHHAEGLILVKDNDSYIFLSPTTDSWFKFTK